MSTLTPRPAPPSATPLIPERLRRDGWWLAETCPPLDERAPLASVSSLAEARQRRDGRA